MRRLVQLALLPAVPLVLGCPIDNGTDPKVKPDAPTIGSATAGDGSAEVSFTAPVNTGTAAITEYRVTCTAGGAATRSATGAASPLTVIDLTNGTTYSCSVTATSSAGTSEPSTIVVVTPATVPGAPTIGTVTAGNASATVAFSAPASNGGAVITGYTATCTATGQTSRTGTATASPITVSSLTNGTQYLCSVVATNTRGNSTASASGSVTPAGTPGAPTIGTATAGNGQASVAFTAPASDGGSPITTYAAVCSASGQTTAQANGTSSPITVTGMSNGVQYGCNVRAANAVGAGAASNNVDVTPLGPPGTPTNVTATPGNASASVVFAVPSNGGSPITAYTALCTTVTAGGYPEQTGTNNTSPITVNGLVNGVQWSCKVKATNAIGDGSYSSGATVTPRTVPGAPTGVSTTAGNLSASVAFTAPSSDGGSSITGYTVTCSATGQTTRTGTGTASPISVSSLVNGVQYSCSVTATNAAGNSAASSAATVTPTNAGLGTSTLCGYLWNAVNNAITNASGTVYTSIVSYTCNATTRTMTMNQIPDHPASALTTGNPNKMSAQTSPSSVSFTLTPATTGTVNTSTHVIGWAINGAKFEPSTAETCPTRSYCSPINGQTVTYTGTWNVEALGQTLFSAGVDGANAHIQPGGAYHYHGMPDAYLTYLNKGQKLTLVGFAVDGFPIYAKWGYSTATDSTTAVIEMTSSYRLKTTIPTGRPDTSIVKYGTFTQDWEYVSNLGHLDECNGRTGVTPEFPAGTYAYYITNGFPYIQRCHKGTVPAGGAP